LTRGDGCPIISVLSVPVSSSNGIVDHVGHNSRYARGVPSRLAHSRIGVDERCDGVVCQLVFQYYKSRLLRTVYPCCKVGFDKRECGATREGHRPVFGVLVPLDGGQPKHLRCNSPNAIIHISHRASPKLGYPATR